MVVFRRWFKPRADNFSRKEKLNNLDEWTLLGAATAWKANKLTLACCYSCQIAQVRHSHRSFTVLTTHHMLNDDGGI